jgi:hypothetical protein
LPPACRFFPKAPGNNKYYDYVIHNIALEKCARAGPGPAARQKAIPRIVPEWDKINTLRKYRPEVWLDDFRKCAKYDAK